MASILTGIINGFQGSSAAHNAGNTVNNAANTGIANTQQAVTGAQTDAQTGMDQSNAAVNAGLTTAQGAYDTATGNLQPYQQAGAGAINTLAGALAPGGSLTQQFNAGDMAQLDPGYAFRLQQGEQALQRSQSANGGALGGGALKQLTRYGQDYASNEYAGAFNRFEQQQRQQYDMLAGVAGFGQAANTQQIAAGNTLTSAGMYGANLKSAATMQGHEYMGNAGLQGANAENQLRMQGAGAVAAGDIGAANAWGSMLNSIGGGIDSALLGGFGGGGGF